MSADVITEIRISGTKEEIKAMLLVIRDFENEKYVQYKEKRDCAYIQSVRVTSNGRSSYTKVMSDEEIDSFVSVCSNTVDITANGPFGVYYTLEDVRLFETISEAAPKAVFSGSSEGYITGASVALIGKLKEGILHLQNYYEADEDMNEEDPEGSEYWDPEKLYDPYTQNYV